MNFELNSITKDLFRLAKEDPVDSARYFKTNKGDYAYRDKFIGVRMPALRKLAKQLKDLPLSQVKQVLRSKFNEERLLALLILVIKYQKSKLDQTKIYQFYIDNLDHVNNWNLVDSSAHLIIGDYLFDKDHSLLFELAKSKNLWHRRVSIIATLSFIRGLQYKTTLKIAKLLLTDEHDLIHKASGWMLREVGRHEQAVLIKFLDDNHLNMPRVMLSYAVERLDAKKKQSYYNKNS